MSTVTTITRAEWFVSRGRGHWAMCRKPFLCDFRGPFGPCLNPVSKGDMYLATDIVKEDKAGHLNAYGLRKLRYCSHCADQELTDQRVGEIL